MAARVKRGLLALSLLAILAATLRPFPGEASARFATCLFCGERAASDALLNLILFLPLGVALGLLVPHGARVFVAPLLITAGIECAQIFIPGRDPSLGDVLFNTSGAALGILLARTAPAWLLPRPRMRAPLAVSAAAVAVLVWAGTGVLLRPSYPGSTWFGQWTPVLSHFEPYRGRVRSASIGPVALPSQQLPHSDDVRRRLLGGEPILVRGTAGPLTPALGPIFSIADDALREILVIGADRGDLVFRFRTRTADFRLDQPDLRLRGAMRGVGRGDPLEVAVWKENGSWCMRLNAMQSCGLAYGVTGGWALLMYPESLPPWFRTLLGYGWVAGLVMPVGFWLRGRAASVAAVALLAGGAALVPELTGLAPLTLLVILSAGVGLGTGLLLQAVAHRACRRPDAPG